MYTTKPAWAFALLSLAALAVTNCASKPRHPDFPEGQVDRGGPPGQGMSRSDIGYIARPISLLFVGMDADHDHKVTIDEVLAGIETEWKSVGKANPDYVSTFEYEAWASVALGDKDAMPNRISFDTDLNGQLTKTEFQTRLNQEFVTLDANADGVLTRQEVLTRLSMGDMGGRGMGGSRGMGGGGRGGPSGGGGSAPRSM